MIKMTWNRLKSITGLKPESIQFIDKVTYYEIWVDIGGQKAISIIKKTNPRKRSQIDFEDNYKANTNKILSNIDSEGSSLTRNKIAPIGWSFHMNGVEFMTSTLGSIVNKDSNETDLNFTTLKLYNNNGDLITNQGVANTDCTKTIIDWEPPFDYEIIGGAIKTEDKTTEDIYLYCIGVPDIPKEYGGSKEFICCVNMKYINSHAEIRADGRIPKLLKYDTVYHTNKMRLILNHEPGTQCNFLLIFEVFKQ